jgi:hypothetical protein
VKWRLYIAVILVAGPLLVFAWGSWPMITFHQTPQDKLATHFVYDSYVREAGYARLTLAITGIILALIPFRRRERWAWFCLATILLLYILPTRILIYGRTMVSWDSWKATFGHFSSSQVASIRVFDHLLTALILLGLLLNFPRRHGPDGVSRGTRERTGCTR